MKELSIEEKAKAYDEAVKRAEEYYKEGKTLEYVNDIVSDIFPELKDEGDEIRKELIDYFSSSHATDTFRGIPWDRVVAWLEKQGKQKPTEFDDTNAKRMFIKALERVEEQNNKGYKLTDCDKNSWWEDFKTYTYCTIEQKSAWSEEDIATISRVISIVKWAAYSDHSHPILNDKGATELVERLKSLKERVQPQPKREYDDMAYEMSRAVLYDKLKDSLRPQNTWKPSDKQMEAVRIAAEIGTANNSWAMGVLNGLYQDLKELREE